MILELWVALATLTPARLQVVHLLVYDFVKTLRRRLMTDENQLIFAFQSDNRCIVCLETFLSEVGVLLMNLVCDTRLLHLDLFCATGPWAL